MRRILICLVSLGVLSAVRAIAGQADKSSAPAKRTAKKTALPKPVQPPFETITNSIGMKLVKIPAGSFMMGSADGFSNEGPAHRVTITAPFYLGATEVTQGQYEQIMGTNPSQQPDSPDHPVDSVSWLKAIEFCEKLSEKEGVKYRLPTEAEWEYSCRAGSRGKVGLGQNGEEVSEGQLEEYAWLRLNSEGTNPVAQKKPNDWGLYDMHGNVFEWCQDNYLPYSAKAATDPVAVAKKMQKDAGESFVLRGGSWEWGLDNSTAAARCRCNKNLRSRTVGFRIARSVEP